MIFTCVFPTELSVIPFNHLTTILHCEITLILVVYTSILIDGDAVGWNHELFMVVMLSYVVLALFTAHHSLPSLLQTAHRTQRPHTHGQSE